MAAYVVKTRVVRSKSRKHHTAQDSAIFGGWVWEFSMVFWELAG